jgi:enoyl-CoA hydratase/carnithine racemase
MQAPGQGGFIRVDRQDGVMTWTLRRAPVNAISQDWLTEAEGALERIESDSSCSVLHIRSDQKAFSAGADLNEMRARMEMPDGADRMYAYVASIQRVFARIQNLPVVTLAEIGGAAMGGGLELALACDLRIAAQDAKFGLPEARLGLLPGAGGTQRLTRLCGAGVAARVILSAEVLDGATAHELGIVQWAVPRNELRQRADEIARRIAALPPAALAASKACIAAARNRDRGGFTDELEFTRQLFVHPETRQRVTAFLAGTNKLPAQASANGGAR